MGFGQCWPTTRFVLLLGTVTSHRGVAGRASRSTWPAAAWEGRSVPAGYRLAGLAFDEVAAAQADAALGSSGGRRQPTDGSW